MLIVRLFLKAPVEPLDQVPVPLNTIAVVPDVVAVVVLVKLAVFIVLPVKVIAVVPPRVNVPLIFRLLERVKVCDVPESEILFQVIPLVLKVVDAAQFNVEPVTITVPAVYVKVPVL